MPLDQPEKLVAVVRRVLDLVAKHYHPRAVEPWLETPVPDLLRIVELVVRDLRRAALSYVPGSHILTIGDLRRLQNWPEWPEKRTSGIARRRLSPMRGRRFCAKAATRIRPAAGCLCRDGQAIGRGLLCPPRRVLCDPLYGRQLAADDTPSDDSPLNQSRHDARAEALRTASLEKEPLRILVAGQTKSGKSSVINALFGEERRRHGRGAPNRPHRAVRPRPRRSSGGNRAGHRRIRHGDR